MVLVLLQYIHCLSVRLLLLIMPLFWCFSGTVAAESLLLDGTQERYELGYYLDTLEDQQGQWSLDDVTSSLVAQEFVRSDSMAPSFGFTSSVIWVRFELKNNLPVSQSLLLQIDFPLLERIQLFKPNSDGFSVISRGTAYPFGYRNNNHRTHVFEINVAPNSTKTYYMKVDGDETIQLPVVLWKPEAFVQHEAYEQYGLGVYFGIIIVMCLYNFFLFLFVRDISYLYYVSYITFFGFFNLSQNGLAFQFLWPDSVYLAKWFNPIGCGVVLVSVVFFTRNFLQTALYSPVVDRLLVLEAMLVGVIYGGVAFGSYQFSASVAGGLSMLVVVTVVAASVHCLRQGYLPARYFLIAFSSVIVGVILFALKSFGLAPANFVTTYSIQIGSSLEIILLSLGLASRINTLKKEKQHAEQSALEAALSANRLKDSFMSTITHELLTPINGIQLSLSLLEGGVREDERKEYLETANDSTRHLLGLVESMFAFSEARRGAMKLEHNKLDFHALLLGIVEQFESVVDKEKVSVVLDWEKTAPHWIWGDRSKLTMIVSQLMKNACIYTNEGEIILRCTISNNPQSDKSGDILTLSITDTGIGISQDIQSKIFEEFTQADNSIQRKYGGMGIGLSIIKDILSLMNGTLALESEPHKGAVFTLEIPIEVLNGCDIVPLDITKVYAIRGRHSKQEKILVVEDNPVNMKLLCKVLEKSNYLPLKAIHGEEALLLLQENTDVVAVLMDCQMPIMDGFEATKRIRQLDQFRALPIIAVTANISESDQQRCRDVGMNDYLAKPVKGPIILEVLTKWTGT
ncbi:hypothetical protein A9Q81_19245 [Gammaproteobacteria bacterium 42_54_T18]|nr:hypothetical protein A9Q81_19245 [Gammaproteobacteria bacterium 42_54_T18]